MTATTDSAGALRERLEAAVLNSAEESGPSTDPAHAALVLVRTAHTATRLVPDVLGEAIGAARATGCSWEQIGATLGMSRQAAQQRFGRPEADDLPEHQVWLGPVTAVDEITALQSAGQQGWRIVSAHMLRFRLAATGTAWEHRRTLVSSRERTRLLADGWHESARWFPYSYLSRDTGVAVPLPTILL